MSICTKTGDSGTTGLMYGHRVPKTHPRVEACGALDELNAAIGLARATAPEDFVRGKLLKAQKDLVLLMGELATVTQDLARYEKDGFQRISALHYQDFEGWIREIEAQKISFKGWATPGANQAAATLDVARAVCRRAERRVQGLLESGEIENLEILIYLNRLSDLLWLLARWCEREPEAQ